MGNKKSKNKATTTWGNCFNVTKKTKPERNSHFYTEGYLWSLNCHEHLISIAMPKSLQEEFVEALTRTINKIKEEIEKL